MCVVWRTCYFDVLLCVAVRNEEYEMKKKGDHRGDYYRLHPEPVVSTPVDYIPNAWYEGLSPVHDVPLTSYEYCTIGVWLRPSLWLVVLTYDSVTTPCAAT